MKLAKSSKNQHYFQFEISSPNGLEKSFGKPEVFYQGMGVFHIISVSGFHGFR